MKHGSDRRKSKSAVKDALALNRKPLVCDCGEGFAIKPVTLRDMKCYACGGQLHRRRIFSLSVGDIWDREVPIEWQAEALHTVYQCGDCVWILCTKRPENALPIMRDILAMQSAIGSLPYDVGFFNWLSQWANDGQPPIHVILLTSVENQEAADKRIPELLKIPAACRGLSLEPLLAPVKLFEYEIVSTGEKWLGSGKSKNGSDSSKKLDWIIIGGESGPNYRPMEIEWLQSLVAQADAAGVPVFVKQDSGKKSGLQGRIPDELWQRKALALAETVKLPE